jgi:hypothetical protein
VEDAFGTEGGRIMVTSLCCLTLEVYYRYLPLYKLDKPDQPASEAAQVSAPEKKQTSKP